MQKAAAINNQNLGISIATTSNSTTNHLSTKSAINNSPSQISPTQIILSPSANGIPANNNSNRPYHQLQHHQQHHHHIPATSGSPLISPAPINHSHHSHHHHYPITTGGGASNYINPISASNAIGFSSSISTSGPSTSSAAAIIDSSIVKEEIKIHFSTGEGIYKKMTVATYSRPNKPTMVNTGSVAVPNCPVRVSFVTLPSASNLSNDENQQQRHKSSRRPSDIICFNVGRELFVFDYVSIQGTPNLNSPIDKRIYKGTFPTCHDFNQETARADVCSLIIGFSAGQIQLIDPLRKEFIPSKLFNEERNIDKTPATCVKWIPGQPTNFMVSHQSGNIYLYNEAFSCFVDIPVYQVFKQGDGFTIYSVKTKNQRNPISRIQIGKNGSAINEFEFFQTDSTLQLAVVSQDGYLRIFDYHAMEIIALMKSYFGGLLCLAWSADGKYIATGGEDDLLTVYSVHEKRVICRGQGHKSWISRVAFDSFATAINDTGSSSSLDDVLNGISESTEELRNNIVYTTASVNKYGYDDSMIYQNTNGIQHVTPIVNIVEPSAASSSHTKTHPIEHSPFEHGTQFTPSQSQVSIAENKNNSISNNSMNLCGLNASQNSIHSGGYRIGTVGHDTQLLLWDINDDILSSPMTTIINPKTAGTTIINVGLSPGPMDGGIMGASTSSEGGESSRGAPSADAPSTSSSSSTKSRFKKFHKRGFSFGNRFGRVSNNSSSTQNGYMNGLPISEQSGAGAGGANAGIFGSPICPKMNQVPIIEPLISKKIAHERLTVLFFREECIVTGCQEGYVCTWARPGRLRKSSIGSEKTTTSALGAIEGLNPNGTNV